MKVAVLGLGRFGTQLVNELVSMGVEVLAIDSHADLGNDVAETATLAAQGNASDIEFLTSLGHEVYDVVCVAIGSEVATSVLVTLNLKRRFGLKHVVAKASTKDHAEALRLAGADLVVSPEQEAAVGLAHTLGPSSHLQEYISLGPTFGCAKVDAPASAVGRALSQLDAFTKHHVLLLAMVREGMVTIRPDREVVVEPGDVWLIAGEDEQLRRAKI